MGGNSKNEGLKTVTEQGDFLVNLISAISEHWGKISAGLAFVLGMAYKAGGSVTKYEDMVQTVADLGETCTAQRLKIAEELSTINANLRLLLESHKLQPITKEERRRKTDE